MHDRFRCKECWDSPVDGEGGHRGPRRTAGETCYQSPKHGRLLIDYSSLDLVPELDTRSTIAGTIQPTILISLSGAATLRTWAKSCLSSRKAASLPMSPPPRGGFSRDPQQNPHHRDRRLIRASAFVARFLWHFRLRKEHGRDAREHGCDARELTPLEGERGVSVWLCCWLQRSGLARVVSGSYCFTTRRQVGRRCNKIATSGGALCDRSTGRSVGRSNCRGRIAPCVAERSGNLRRTT
jgi:hypothetical protein